MNYLNPSDTLDAVDDRLALIKSVCLLRETVNLERGGANVHAANIYRQIYDWLDGDPKNTLYAAVQKTARGK